MSEDWQTKMQAIRSRIIEIREERKRVYAELKVLREEEKQKTTELQNLINELMVDCQHDGKICVAHDGLGGLYAFCYDCCTDLDFADEEIRNWPESDDIVWIKEVSD